MKQGNKLTEPILNDPVLKKAVSRARLGASLIGCALACYYSYRALNRKYPQTMYKYIYTPLFENLYLPYLEKVARSLSFYRNQNYATQ